MGVFNHNNNFFILIVFFTTIIISPYSYMFLSRKDIITKRDFSLLFYIEISSSIWFIMSLCYKILDVLIYFKTYVKLLWFIFKVTTLLIISYFLREVRMLKILTYDVKVYVLLDNLM